MKQKVLLSSVILLVIEFVLFFTPYCFIVNYWQYKSSLTYHGIKSLEYKEHVDIFAMNDTIARIFAISSIILVAIALFAYVMMLLGKNTALTKFTYYIPIVIFAVSLLHFLYLVLFAEYDSASWYEDCSANWGAYVIVSMNTVLAILGYLLKQDRFSPKYANENTDKAPPATEISDELKVYKKLLDDGIITQEDFDAKKKQALGL